MRNSLKAVALSLAFLACQPLFADEPPPTFIASDLGPIPLRNVVLTVGNPERGPFSMTLVWDGGTNWSGITEDETMSASLDVTGGTATFTASSGGDSVSSSALVLFRLPGRPFGITYLTRPRTSWRGCREFCITQ